MNMNKMTDAERAEYWEGVAIHLASCNAGTLAYDGELKRTSKSSRKRFRSICETSLSMLDGTWSGRNPTDRAWVVTRLRRALGEHKDTDQKGGDVE